MPKSISEMLATKVFEPQPRNKDGWRYHRHRFPIKGGISQLEVVQRTLGRSLEAPSFFSKLIDG